jgi:hypothetical protein
VKSVRVLFRQIGQIEQRVAPEPDDQSMVSDVLFDVVVDGTVHRDLVSHIRQTPGGEYDTDLLEVELPERYIGPMNYAAFRDCVESYYRAALGGVVGPGTWGLLNDNLIVLTYECTFEAEEVNA